MACVTSVSYTVQIHGHGHGFFNPKRSDRAEWRNIILFRDMHSRPLRRSPLGMGCMMIRVEVRNVCGCAGSSNLFGLF